MLDPIEAFVPVTVLADDLLLVDWGPMTMTISVWDKEQARPVMAAIASRSALTCLQVLSDFQGFLKVPVCSLPSDPQLPDVVSRAFIAAAKVSKELTSLAAVAGAAADHVADAAMRMGADKVIVNNGGDIALRLAMGKTAVVGLKAIGAEKMAGRLYVRGGSGIGGVASSGWMGRSYSPGVADLVTVWGSSASIADAAATLIAGKITACGMNVEQARAADLDPASDLGDMKVTTAVHKLSPSQRKDALDRGAAVAAGMYSSGLIHGCFLSVQGDFSLLDPEGIAQIES
jgi:ApbE superfamily uncharacterized protein (UPF0280 family)